MKKALSVLLATVMVAGLALTGCGGGGNADTKAPEATKAPAAETTAPKGDETQAPAGETQAPAGETQAQGEDDGIQAADKIIIFQSKVEIQDALQELAEVYKEETGVEVEIWGTTGDGYLQQLKAKLANNQGPTIFNQGGGAEVEQIQGYCADLSDLPFISSIADGMTDSSTVDGKVLGIPYTVEGFGLVYNKDLIDATTLKSTEDFINAIKEQKAAGVEGFELSQEDYFLIGHILNTPFALQDDPEKFVADVAAGTVKMADNDIFKEFADMLVQIRENCENPLEQNYDGEVGDLATGKAAMIHQGNWCANMFTDYGFTNAGLAPLPLAGNDKLAVAVPTFWSVNSAATPEEQKAGKEFLTWLYTSETGKDYLYNKFLFIPLIDGDTNENLDVLSADVAKYVADGKTIGWPNKLWPASAVNVYFAPLTQEFFTSNMSAAEFLEKLDQAYADAVANQS